MVIIQGSWLEYFFCMGRPRGDMYKCDAFLAGNFLTFRELLVIPLCSGFLFFFVFVSTSGCVKSALMLITEDKWKKNKKHLGVFNFSDERVARRHCLLLYERHIYSSLCYKAQKWSLMTCPVWEWIVILFYFPFWAQLRRLCHCHFSSSTINGKKTKQNKKQINDLSIAMVFFNLGRGTVIKWLQWACFVSILHLFDYVRW